MTRAAPMLYKAFRLVDAPSQPMSEGFITNNPLVPFFVAADFAEKPRAGSEFRCYTGKNVKPLFLAQSNCGLNLS